MKKIITLAALAMIVYACSNNAPSQQTAAPAAAAQAATDAYDTAHGEGKFTNVTINPALDKSMAALGQKVYDVKCASCHKTTGEKLVGPGWLGVTSRHRPEWILNFVTNTEAMLGKDPKAQAMLELCLVRMPNQNLTDEDARHVYEFMRKNDGVK